MNIKYMLDTEAYPIAKAHPADAGYDLRAVKDCFIHHLDGEVIETGVHVEIPQGYVGYVQGRSGLNINHDIICPTGTIDSGYTGSIKVKLYNLGTETYHIHRGDKVAQLVIQPMAVSDLVEMVSLEETDRGDKGFGSSGR